MGAGGHTNLVGELGGVMKPACVIWVFMFLTGLRRAALCDTRNSILCHAPKKEIFKIFLIFDALGVWLWFLGWAYQGIVKYGKLCCVAALANLPEHLRDESFPLRLGAVEQLLNCKR
jgi:hypothetical protein